MERVKSKKFKLVNKMSFEESKQIASKFIDEVFNKGNVKEADRFVTPGFMYHARGEDVEGLEKFKE